MKTSTYLKKLFLAVLLATPFGGAFAQVVTVGAGTTTTSSMTETPYGTFYMDDRTQYLYTPSEISAAGGYAGFINAIAFRVSGNASMAMNNFTISMGTTSATSIAGGYAPATLTPVYSGTVTTSIGWNTYTFTTPFFWNGTENLVVDVCFDNSSWSSPSGTVYADYITDRVYSRWQDNSSGSICGTTNGSGGTGYYRAQTQFTIVPPYADDAGIAAIINPSLPTCDLDSVDIEVVVTNAGTDTLTSCTIKWQIGNGTPTSYSYTGAVTPQGGTDTVILANYSFSNLDELTVWTEAPNGQVDSLPANDTASMILATGLAGTYNVPSDFSTITDAATALNTFGVCDDVIIELSTGVYTEQVVLGEVLGVSADKTITFTSASGNMDDAVIQYASSGSSDNYVVYLNGSDWVRFEDVTIRNTATSLYATAVRLENGAEHNTFDHCHIKAGSYGYTGNLLSAVYSQGLNHHLTLTNNWIEKGGYGIYVYGNGTTNKVENVVIENNQIEDAYYMQNYLWYIDGLEFNNNVVTNDTNMYLIPYGVYMYYVDDFNFTGNYVGATGTYANNSSYGGYAYTVYMYSCIGGSNPRAQFSNNCINASRPGAIYYGYYGVYMGQCGLIDFHHNTISRHGGYDNYYTANINGGGAISVLNNSFADYKNGYAMYAPGVWTITNSDYNNFYSSGNNLVYFGSSTYTSLENLQVAEGVDMHSVSTDPAFVDTLACITCNDTLNNAGTPVNSVDIDSNVRSISTPDIGAVEWVSPTTFTLGGDSTYCADQVILEAGPAQSVTWSVNGNSSTAPSITLNGGTQATTYNVLVSIQTQHCGSASDNALITLVPNAHLDSAMHICAGTSTTLNPGGLASGTYNWSTGANTQSIVVSSPGAYSVTKNVMGCVSTASTVVSQSQAVEIIGTEVCIDDLPLTLDASIANGTSYAWSGGSSPGTAVNTFSAGGPFTVTATDAFGCTSVDSFEVVVLEEPNAVIGIQSNSGTIYIFDASSSSFLTASSSVNWSFGAAATPAASTNVVETVSYPWPNPSNPASYSVSLEINNGCGVDITTQVITPDPLNVAELKPGEFGIFPNPASDVITVATKDMAAGNIQVLDMSGRIVAQLPMSAGSNQHEVTIRDLAAGSYLVKVVTESASQVKPLIVR